MGFVDWISSWFQPKEIKEALRDAQLDIRQAEEEARKHALPATKAELAEAKRAIWTARKNIGMLRKVAREELKEPPIPPKAEDVAAVEQAFFKGRYKTEAEREAEVVKAIEASGRPMKLDVLERQVGAAKILGGMAGNLKEAEKVSIRVAQEVTSEENEIERLGALLAERAEISSQLSEVMARKLQSFDKNIAKAEQRLTEQLRAKDQQALAAFQRITNMASHGSALRSDLDHIVQLLTPVSSDAKMLVERIKDEVGYATEMLKFQGAIVAAMKPALKAKETEIERIEIFLKALEKRTGT
jgi:hypothetical protein